jgi:hypothetical protein
MPAPAAAAADIGGTYYLGYAYIIYPFAHYLNLKLWKKWWMNRLGTDLWTRRLFTEQVEHMLFSPSISNIVSIHSLSFIMFL